MKTKSKSKVTIRVYFYDLVVHALSFKIAHDYCQSLVHAYVQLSVDVEEITSEIFQNFVLGNHILNYGLSIECLLKK